MKKYILSINFGNAGKYTLTGNSAAASFNPSALVADDNVETLVSGKVVKLSGANKYHITRARLVSTGAPGLETGSGVAASLNCAVAVVSGSSMEGDPIAEFKLDINRWNEWEAKDIFINHDEDHREGQVVVKTTSTLYVHDYNVQTDYVGADVKPTLELEIEGDFVTASDTNV